MPRVHRVTANKDHPAYGITKGQLHYTWSLRTGPRSSRTFRQIAPPKPSQLTTSAFLGAIGDLQQDGFNNLESPDDLREIANQVRELGTEEAEKLENMPDGLKEGPTGELLQERADGCESWADEIEGAADDWENALTDIGEGNDDEPADEYEPDGETLGDKREEARDEAVDTSSGASPF